MLPHYLGRGKPYEYLKRQGKDDEIVGKGEKRRRPVGQKIQGNYDISQCCEDEKLCSKGRPLVSE